MTLVSTPTQSDMPTSVEQRPVADADKKDPIKVGRAPLSEAEYVAFVETYNANTDAEGLPLAAWRTF